MASQQLATTSQSTPKAIPARRLATRGEIFALYVATSFPIFVWAIANVLVTISQWLLRLTPGEIVGVSAYILGFAFVESLIMFLVLWLVARLLPARWLGRAAAPLALVFTGLTLGLLIYLNMKQESAIGRGNFDGALLAFAAYAALLGLSAFVIRRSERLTRLLNAFVDRLAPLAVLYALIGLLGLIVIVIRNVS